MVPVRKDRRHPGYDVPKVYFLSPRGTREGEGPLKSRLPHSMLRAHTLLPDPSYAEILPSLVLTANCRQRQLPGGQVLAEVGDR